MAFKTLKHHFNVSPNLEFGKINTLFVGRQEEYFLTILDTIELTVLKNKKTKINSDRMFRVKKEILEKFTKESITVQVIERQLSPNGFLTK